MPLPTPNIGESRDDFMNRCISFVVNEGTEQEQAIAICNRQWEENKMFYCKELNKNFKTKTEMFSDLKNSYKDIIADKRARIYNSKKGCEEKCSINTKPIDPKKLKIQVKGIDIDDSYYYIAVNTTKILDAHKDLHLNGLWNKTIKEQQGKIYLVLDHEISVLTTVVRKEHIEIFVAEIPFSLLGQKYEGVTEALIYKFRKDKIINNIAKEWLESGDEIQASVRMQYIKILFALNSNDPDDKEFKKNYDQYINQIANKEDFDEIEYFWPVQEAANKLESSLVLFGSNHVTGRVNENEPDKSTHIQNNEPQKSTHRNFYLSLLKNN